MPTEAEILFSETHFGLPVSERLAINATLDLQPSRILCTTIGRGQAAIQLAKQFPDADVYCHFIDSFPASETADFAAELSSSIQVICSADLPDEEFDLCVLPMSRSGESELSRDLLQQAYDRLSLKGILVVTIDNAKDTWFHHEVEKLGKNLTRLQKRKGVAYKLRKLKPLKKLKDYSCEFAFRDGEQLVKAISLPGVFSHRRLDLGARALIESMTVSEGDRVLDIGCGSGTVGLAAGLRAADVSVHFLDANARAVECAVAGAQVNGLDNVAATLSHDGSIGSVEDTISGTFDLAIGNPPYYSHFQIAEIFLQAGLNILKPGGRIQIVTKNPEWLEARMRQLFDDVTITETRGYSVGSGIKRTSGPRTASAE